MVGLGVEGAWHWMIIVYLHRADKCCLSYSLCHNFLNFFSFFQFYSKIVDSCRNFQKNLLLPNLNNFYVFGPGINFIEALDFKLKLT